MTVNTQIPFTEYQGNAVSTNFAFVWTQQEPIDMSVTIDGVEAQEGIDYDLQNFDKENGGIVFITPPPDADTKVFIERVTPITQENDYLEFSSFPAETHEEQMDKDTLILQEEILGVRIFGGEVNLDSVPGADFVDVTNTAGDDARLPSWDCLNPLAGVFHGTVTETAPIDGSATSKPDGYIWFEIPAP